MNLLSAARAEVAFDRFRRGFFRFRNKNLFLFRLFGRRDYFFLVLFKEAGRVHVIPATRADGGADGNFLAAVRALDFAGFVRRVDGIAEHGLLRCWLFRLRFRRIGGQRFGTELDGFLQHRYAKEDDAAAEHQLAHKLKRRVALAQNERNDERCDYRECGGTYARVEQNLLLHGFLLAVGKLKQYRRQRQRVEQR
ncbi:hypothetical protein SDC9_116175 [bioreactor metagenome]|uniref:Uncharacterized protein n=1 Tax=bioreactor metagenome TaxID=1076179 RepID=A0A645BX52_9ZZZZ